MASKAVELPEKDYENFKKAERLYNKKQYKQAIKQCDLVLKKFENHGETLALKGAAMGILAISDEEKQEAVDVCKRGVGLSMSSKASWIHLARLYRQVWRYEESIKAFKNAINLPLIQWVTAHDRLQWKRELTFLLAQVRNWDELAEIRRQLQADFQGDPSQFAGYCIAKHFAGQHETALSSLRDYRKSLTTQANSIAELDLLEARFIEASGDKAGALAFYNKLLENKQANLLTQQENKARILLEMGNFVDAAENYLHLLRDRNQENYDYHRGLQCALACNADGFKPKGLDLPVSFDSPQDIVSKVSATYATLLAEFPKSFAIERIPLDFCADAEFEAKASKFIHRLWKKRVACLFSMLKPLLVSRAAIARKSFHAIVDARLQASDLDKEERGQILLFQALLLDKIEPGCAAALKAIDAALATEPESKNPDFLRYKARFLKHTGDFTAAFDVLDLARQQELSDRYLNNKCAKYAFRKDQPDLALALTHLFTRGEDIHSLPDAAILHDLQCMWFELEAAESALRTGDVILAIKNFYWVEDHIEQVREDEHDFHEYALRKFRYTSYLDLIRMEDTVYSAPAFLKSAKGSLRAWLRVFDQNAGLDVLKKHEKEMAQLKKAEAASTDESQFAGMTPNEKKQAMKRIKAEKAEKERLEAVRKLEESNKLLQAASNAAAAADDEGAAASATEEKKDLSAGMNAKPTTKRRADMAMDPDPLGFTRFAKYSKDPLRPALELLDLAFKKSSANLDNVDLLLLAFDVNVRVPGGKQLGQAWKYLRDACSKTTVTQQQAAGILLRLVKFAHFLAKGGETPACWSKGGVVVPANKFVLAATEDAAEINMQVAAALGGAKPAEYAAKALKDASSSLDVILASAEALLEIGAEVEAATSKLVGVVAPFTSCQAAQAVLAKFDKTAAATHRAAANKVWPNARAFA